MGILAGLVILCVVLSFTTSSFATVTNLFNVVRQITINLFLACGMTFVILLAGIDLSVGSVIAVSGCISAGLISWNGLPVYIPKSDRYIGILRDKRIEQDLEELGASTKVQRELAKKYNVTPRWIRSVRKKQVDKPSATMKQSRQLDMFAC